MSFFNNNCIGIVVLLFVRFLLVSCNSNAYSNTTRPINTDSTVTNTVTVTVSNSNRNINSNSSNYSGKQNGNSGSDNNQVAPTITNTSSTTNSISSSNNHNRQLLTNTTTGIRGAVVITLASSNKLAPYFEWTCRSFSSSGSLYDLLVFHEGNKALQTIKCARNVHLIDLKRNGLAKLIVSRLLDQQNVSKDVHFELRTILSEIILRCPRYLIEIKPLTGYLFKDYLQDYSHWTYSDPDIIWGNLDDWIDVQDIIDYDIVTVGKYMDAARLFLRGQVILYL